MAYSSNCQYDPKWLKFPEHLSIITLLVILKVDSFFQVDYFNNYLRDPKRPQLPEYPGNKHGGRKDDRPDPYVATYPQHIPDNR